MLLGESAREDGLGVEGDLGLEPGQGGEQYSTVQYSTVQYSTVQCSTVPGVVADLVQGPRAAVGALRAHRDAETEKINCWLMLIELSTNFTKYLKIFGELLAGHQLVL